MAARDDNKCEEKPEARGQFPGRGLWHSRSMPAGPSFGPGRSARTTVSQPLERHWPSGGFAPCIRTNPLRPLQPDQQVLTLEFCPDYEVSNNTELW